MVETILETARNHLSAAVHQSIDSDDQIIMNHVRAAYELLRFVGPYSIQPHMHVAGTTVGRHIDECAVCGQDLRCAVHANESQSTAAQPGADDG